MGADLPKVLLTGASGFLGRYLAAELRGRGLRVITAGRSGADLCLDLAAPDSVRAAVAAARAELVLSCAALSSMRDCAQQRELATAVNATAPAVLAESGVRVLHVSTDLVFDGTAPPYAPGAAPRPLSVYGATKAAGEAPVVAAGGLVVRVPLLFGTSADGRRGATDMIRSAGAAPLTLFTNEHRTPLHAADAARALVDLLMDRARAGIAHLAGPERVSRYELGRRFAALAGLTAIELHPGSCTDPERPRDVSLRGDAGSHRTLDAALRAS